MDPFTIPPLYIQDVQWPLNLYANLNPAGEWKKPIAPGNPIASSLSTEQPQTVQNNLAMLSALSNLNWPIIRAALEIGTYTLNEQALQIAAQDRNFVNEQALQIATQTMNFENDATGRLQTNRQYNEKGTMTLLNGGLTGQIDLLA